MDTPSDAATCEDRTHDLGMAHRRGAPGCFTQSVGGEMEDVVFHLGMEPPRSTQLLVPLDWIGLL